jgi:hypothetical protein
MRGLLRNPKVVVVITVVAVANLLWSFWPAQRQIFQESPLAVTPVSPDSAVRELDTASRGIIDSIMWKRKANRNPFFAEARQGEIPNWILGKEDLPREKVILKKVAKGKKHSPRPILQAVALGPGGQLALIDGRWLKPGALLGASRIEGITPDTVWLRTGKIRAGLTFQNGH